MTKHEYASYRSKVFTRYNKLRKVFRDSGWPMAYLNRALGLALSAERFTKKLLEYNTGRHTCDCKDWEFHYRKVRRYTGPCKHMIALDIVPGAVFA